MIKKLFYGNRKKTHIQSPGINNNYVDFINILLGLFTELSHKFHHFLIHYCYYYCFQITYSYNRACARAEIKRLSADAGRCNVDKRTTKPYIKERNYNYESHI